MRTRRDAGWGRLPRRIARALAGAKLNGSESRVVWAIVYYTFAWNKAEDRITWGQISEITGIDEWHLGRSINSLLKKGVIFMKGNRYGIQLDFSKWKTPPKRVVKKKTPPDWEKTPPDWGENTTQTGGLLRTILRTDPKKEKVVSQPVRKKGESPEGLKKLIDDIGNFPGLKK